MKLIFENIKIIASSGLVFVILFFLWLLLSFLKILFPQISILTNIYILISVLTLIIIFLYWLDSVRRSRKYKEEKVNRRIYRAELRVEREPEKTTPAWDLARVTLESYFNRNLNQVTAIFWLCSFVMMIGFFIIAFGIVLAIQSPDKPLVSIITGVAGLFTELIGATFLFVYRSTMQQALNYTKTLERINSVGMAMQILDTLPDDAQSDNLKNQTKAAVVQMLMKQSFNIEDIQPTQKETKDNSKSET